MLQERCARHTSTSTVRVPPLFPALGTPNKQNYACLRKTIRSEPRNVRLSPYTCRKERSAQNFVQRIRVLISWSRLAIRPPEGFRKKKNYRNRRRSRVTAPADLEPPRGLSFGLGLGSGWCGPTRKIEIDHTSCTISSCIPVLHKRSFVQTGPAHLEPFTQRFHSPIFFSPQGLSCHSMNGVLISAHEQRRNVGNANSGGFPSASIWREKIEKRHSKNVTTSRLTVLVGPSAPLFFISCVFVEVCLPFK